MALPCITAFISSVMRQIKKIGSMLLLIMCCLIISADGQVIKRWKGRYPQMNNNYPVAFIAFKGWLPPIPHFFVRLLPTHYYYQLTSIPALDAKELTGKTKTSLMRIVARMLEKGQIKDRFKHIDAIQEMTDTSLQIEERLFNAQSDQLSDIYAISVQLVAINDQLNGLRYHKGGQDVKDCFEKELDDLLHQFLMVNLLQSDHGSKLEAFSEIQTSVRELSGEVNYAISKLRYFNTYGYAPASNYAFLTR